MEASPTWCGFSVWPDQQNIERRDRTGRRGLVASARVRAAADSMFVQYSGLFCESELA